MQELIIVNEADDVLGYGEKIHIHREAILHRAFSIFIINDKNELMLQRRSTNKYHSGGLWTNTCCSHPLKGADIKQTIHKRLMEEMGFDCDLTFIFKFRYKAELDHGMVEHEVDHVYLGHYNGIASPCPSEVSEWKWVNLDQLTVDLKDKPEEYTYWLRQCYHKFKKHYISLS